ncbi:hypothetical protein P152DRAFT_30522 [Eremomyces bilateralis CBS 781.70]|uniref:BTB domain-containing protein n=1 Tax=Eremomyces bilateralis CBS 781.70 TaxID=1392243 RepID=A0A6G1G2C9_9PEZI|nr:uncharacterized protein P152DRAFT_30522 [Eremomyces bilateralis CBS 781.70]KAF1812267.1 hypothetical protein P152DRAFT_30522 [Eremomyces bilateralis CBS 781.70]
MTPSSMVSHPLNPATASASNSRDLTLRRAPSITSTRTALTHRRHHRNARSHVGTSSHQPQNEFPIFTHTGDVEILLTDREGRRETRFLLHRLILAQCSGFFEAGTRGAMSDM